MKVPQIFIKGFSLDPFMNHSIETLLDKKPDNTKNNEPTLLIVEIADEDKNFMLQSTTIQVAPEIFS